MATLDELIVRIEANTAQLRREMKRADTSVARGSRRMGRSLKKIDQSFARVGRAATGFVLAVSGEVSGDREVSGIWGQVSVSGDSI